MIISFTIDVCFVFLFVFLDFSNFSVLLFCFSNVNIMRNVRAVIKRYIPLFLNMIFFLCFITYSSKY